MWFILLLGIHGQFIDWIREMLFQRQWRKLSRLTDLKLYALTKQVPLLQTILCFNKLCRLMVMVSWREQIVKVNSSMFRLSLRLYLVHAMQLLLQTKNNLETKSILSCGKSQGSSFVKATILPKLSVQSLRSRIQNFESQPIQFCLSIYVCGGPIRGFRQCIYFCKVLPWEYDQAFY